MNAYVIIFLLVNTLALAVVPRRWAPLPLLIGACYITSGQVIELGPLHFTVIRILIGAGLVRMIIRGERLAGRMNGLDRLMLVWVCLDVDQQFISRRPIGSAYISAWPRLRRMWHLLLASLIFVSHSMT